LPDRVKDILKIKQVEILIKNDLRKGMHKLITE